MSIDLKTIAKLLGAKGGQATKNKHKHDHFVAIGKKGAEKRWKNK